MLRDRTHPLACSMRVRILMRLGLPIARAKIKVTMSYCQSISLSQVSTQLCLDLTTWRMIRKDLRYLDPAHIPASTLRSKRNGQVLLRSNRAMEAPPPSKITQQEMITNIICDMRKRSHHSHLQNTFRKNGPSSRRLSMRRCPRLASSESLQKN